MLIDLDELVLRCRDDRARSYIKEAVACYKGGAFRSCIVATWNAVVFDYLHKLRELDMTGDKNASKILKEFEEIRLGGEQRLQDALKFERSFVDIAAKEFELLTPLELNDLERLQEDRNRCAHPSMQSHDEPYQPSAELARAHLRNAVEAMLERPPVQGKAAFNRISDEVGFEYFPTDPEQARERFEAGPLQRARTSLIRSLTIGFAKALLSGEKGEAEQARIRSALGGIHRLHRETVEHVLREELPKIVPTVTAENVWRIVDLAVAIPPAWEAFGAGIQGAVRSFLSEAEETDPAFIPTLKRAFDVKQLEATAESRTLTVSAAHFIEVLNERPRRAFFERAIREYAEARGFRAAERLGNDMILPLAPVMTATDVERILQAVTENSQIYDAAGTQGVLFDLFVETSHLQTGTIPHWQDLLNRLKRLKDAGTLNLNHDYEELQGIVPSGEDIWRSDDDDLSDG